MSSIELKKIVAYEALKYVKDGIILGVGTGSTAMEFLRLLAEKIRNGEFKDLILVPTSTEVEYYATILGIGKYIKQFWQVDYIDLAIDSADEVDYKKNLVKGGGAALTREKIVDYSASHFIVIVDESKLSPVLGLKHSIPIEVIPIAWKYVCKEIERRFGGKTSLRILEKGKRGPVITDNGNYVIDWFPDKEIENVSEIELNVKSIPGVVEVGLFSGSKVSKVLIATKNGIEIIE